MDRRWALSAFVDQRKTRVPVPTGRKYAPVQTLADLRARGTPRVTEQRIVNKPGGTRTLGENLFMRKQAAGRRKVAAPTGKEIAAWAAQAPMRKESAWRIGGGADLGASPDMPVGTKYARRAPRSRVERIEDARKRLGRQATPGSTGYRERLPGYIRQELQRRDVGPEGQLSTNQMLVDSATRMPFVPPQSGRIKTYQSESDLKRREALAKQKRAGLATASALPSHARETYAPGAVIRGQDVYRKYTRGPFAGAEELESPGAMKPGDVARTAMQHPERPDYVDIADARRFLAGPQKGMTVPHAEIRGERQALALEQAKSKQKRYKLGTMPTEESGVFDTQTGEWLQTPAQLEQEALTQSLDVDKQAAIKEVYAFKAEALKYLAEIGRELTTEEKAMLKAGDMEGAQFIRDIIMEKRSRPEGSETAGSEDLQGNQGFEDYFYGNAVREAVRRDFEAAKAKRAARFYQSQDKRAALRAKIQESAEKRRERLGR